MQGVNSPSCMVDMYPLSCMVRRMQCVWKWISRALATVGISRDSSDQLFVGRERGSILREGAG